MRPGDINLTPSATPPPPTLAASYRAPRESSCCFLRLPSSFLAAWNEYAQECANDYDDPRSNVAGC